MGYTLDTGALIALQRQKRRAWGFMHLAAADEQALRAPSVVLTEFWRGQSTPRALTEILDHAVEWIDPTPRLCRQAGLALRDAGRGPSAVDALVATVAAVYGDIVLTSDVGDFERLRSVFPGLRALPV